MNRETARPNRRLEGECTAIDSSEKKIFASLLDLPIFQHPAVKKAAEELLEQDQAEIAVAAKQLYMNHLERLAKPYNVVGTGKYEVIETKKGDGVISLIEEAQNSLFLTHFTPAVYSKRYIKVQVEKLNQGLRCSRIVAYHPAHLDSYRWLLNFYRKNKRQKKLEPIGNYQQYKYVGTPLSSDIMIIDKKTVLIWHRRHYESEDMDLAILYYNAPMVARLYFNQWLSFMPIDDEFGKESRINIEKDDLNELMLLV